MSGVREIKLGDLRAVVRKLNERVQDSGFEPDCIVYLERGARLIAAELQTLRQVGAIPLHAQRAGGRWKDRAATALASLPDFVKTGLRKIESHIQVKKAPSKRTISPRPSVELSAKRVLVVDDAVDSGASINAAIDWIVSMGASRADIHVAVITVTTPVAAHLVNSSLYSEICRFPWSTDSAERNQYLKRYERTKLEQYSTRSV